MVRFSKFSYNKKIYKELRKTFSFWQPLEKGGNKDYWMYQLPDSYWG